MSADPIAASATPSVRLPEPLKLSLGLAATAAAAFGLMQLGAGPTVVPPPPPRPVFTGEVGDAKLAVTVVPPAVSLAQGITATFTDPASDAPFTAVRSVRARVVPPGGAAPTKTLTAANPTPGVYSITLVNETAFQTPGPHTVRLSVVLADGARATESIPVKVAAKPKPPAVPTRK